RFKRAVVTVSPPATGVHVSVYMTKGPPMSPWCNASDWTWGVFPCYDDRIISQVHFDVFVDQAFKQSYQYDIRKRGVFWIGLLPLAWVSLFNTHYTEAFSATVYQFITDAKRDGFL